MFVERSGLAFRLGQLHPFTLVPLWGLAGRCTAGQVGSGAAVAVAAPDLTSGELQRGLAGCLDGAEQAVGFVVDAGGEQQGG
jgi:hypothetical protein